MMVLVLDLMLAICALVLLGTAPWVLKWLEETLVNNPRLKKLLQVVAAMVVLVPMVSFALSQLQQRTSQLTPEVTRQIAVGAATTWGVLCLLIPAVILSCGEASQKNKEVFRLAVGFFLSVNVALLAWAVTNEVARMVRQKEAVVLIGTFRWVAPVGLCAIIALHFLYVKISEIIYRNVSSEPATQQTSPDDTKSTTLPTPIAPPIQDASVPTASRKRKGKTAQVPPT